MSRSATFMYIYDHHTINQAAFTGTIHHSDFDSYFNNAVKVLHPINIKHSHRDMISGLPAVNSLIYRHSRWCCNEYPVTNRVHFTLN